MIQSEHLAQPTLLPSHVSTYPLKKFKVWHHFLVETRLGVFIMENMIASENVNSAGWKYWWLSAVKVAGGGGQARAQLPATVTLQLPTVSSCSN